MTLGQKQFQPICMAGVVLVLLVLEVEGPAVVDVLVVVGRQVVEVEEVEVVGAGVVVLEVLDDVVGAGVVVVVGSQGAHGVVDVDEVEEVLPWGPIS
jgi:hypothetical protein